MTPSILVVADGTRGAAGALQMAKRLAERENARVEVLAVHDPTGLRLVDGHDAVAPMQPPAVDGVVDALRRRTQSQLDELGGGADRWPLTVEVGRIGPIVARVAGERGAGRVVLELREAEAGAGWMARETLLDLIRRLQVPVLAVPRGFGELPRRVIVAVDFSRYSLEIAREALDDLEPGAQLHLVNVVSDGPRPGGGSQLSGLSVPDRLGLERRLMELASELEIPEIAAVETHLLYGDPADEILRLADEVGAELIAAGSHGASYPGQVLTGDVYGKLVHGAGCSVLIGPPRGMRPHVSTQREELGSLQPIVA
jgi:universal stress protein A